MLIFSRKQILIIMLVLFVVVSTFSFADARHLPEQQGLENAYPKLPGLDPLSTRTTLPQLINYVFRFSIFVSGLVAFGAMVFAGFLFMTSGANPGLRAKAKQQVQNVMLGLVLLFSTYLILNTINPELVFLYTPGENEVGGTFKDYSYVTAGDNINLDSLKYGGVVIGQDGGDDGLYGKTGATETVINGIKNFDSGAYIRKDTLRSIRILGTCTVGLFNDSGWANSLASLTGPRYATSDQGAFAGDSVESLKFTNRSCLGNAITVYSANGVLNEDGFGNSRKPFITSDPDLMGNYLLFESGLPHNADNNIEAIKFTDSGATTFNITLCKNPLHQENSKDECVKGLSTDIPALDAQASTELKKLHNQISAITFGGDGRNRQAGVILYEHDNFEGRSEIFIAGDRDFGQNWMKHDKASSLKIIGKYLVILYEKNLDDDNGGKQRVFDNTVGSLSANTAASANISEDLARGGAGKSSGIVEIPKLSAYEITPSNDWNDKVSAIRIAVPQTLYNTQTLGSNCLQYLHPNDSDVPDNIPSGICEL